MRGADIQPAGTPGAARGTAAGDHRDDDAGRFRTPLPGDRRSAVRSGHARMESILPARGSSQPGAGAVLRRREHAPWAGSAHGRTVGALGGGHADVGSGFDQRVPRDGYAWWYLDALSDDGRFALTLIALVGGVFSPYYARARARGEGDPLNHCAFNVALYGASGKRWALTERGRDRVHTTARSLAIGPSSAAWEGDALAVSIDEVTAPFPSRIRGVVRLYPGALVDESFALDQEGRHRWRPIAPCARVEVRLDQPALRWAGRGYFDANWGTRPLERDFSGWHWCRAALPGGAAVLYDVAQRNGENLSLALRFGEAGGIQRLPPPAWAQLPPTRWRLARRTRAENGAARVLRTLEDTPFYARSLLSAQLFGERTTAVHESLSMRRFSARWVQMLLPFRAPRAPW